MKGKFSLLILTIMWFYNPSSLANTTSTESITKTVLDYAEGYYSGDSGRMQEALHPDLNKVRIAKISGVSDVFLTYSTVSSLIKLTELKLGYLNEKDRIINIDILSHDEKVACVKVSTTHFSDFLNLVKTNNGWKIINVLWLAPNDFLVNSQSRNNKSNKYDQLAVTGVLDEFMVGLNTGNLSKTEKHIHPECNIISLMNLRNTDEFIVQKSGKSQFLVSARKKNRNYDFSSYTSSIKVLDIIDKIVFVESKLPGQKGYFQMYNFNNSWQIINALFVPEQ